MIFLGDHLGNILKKYVINLKDITLLASQYKDFFTLKR